MLSCRPSSDSAGPSDRRAGEWRQSRQSYCEHRRWQLWFPVGPLEHFLVPPTLPPPTPGPRRNKYQAVGERPTPERGPFSFLLVTRSILTARDGRPDFDAALGDRPHTTPLAEPSM